MSMLRVLLVGGALLGGLGVAAGSFGAHGLKDLLEANGQAANWETAVRYCLIHAVTLVLIGSLMLQPQGVAVRGWLAAAGGSVFLGTLVFSGVLAALAITGIRPLGAIVPIGGVLLLVGWGLLLAGVARIGSD
jgi:uncharacterized membrane protein YgdD (TMEM256/DUF423 family)